MPLPETEGTGLGKPLKLITKPVRDRIPIHLAALGEKNVALAAELADGWLPLFFIPEKAKEVFEASLEAGAAIRDPMLGTLDICAGGMVAITDDLDQARAIRDFARPLLALYIGGMGAKGRNFYNALACRYGYEREAAQIQDLYLEGRKDEAAAAVPEELLELTSLCGPEGYVKDRIAAFGAAGVTILNVLPVGADPVRLIDQLRGWTN